MNSTEAFFFDFVSLNQYWGFQVSTFWLRLSRLRWWSRLQNLNGKVSLESADDMPNILMKFLLPFCSCNKTWITDILNVKKTLHKILPSTTLCATPPTLKTLIPRHHYNYGTITAPSQFSDTCLSCRQRWQKVRSRKWRLFEDGGKHWSALFDIWRYQWPARIELWHIEGINHTKLWLWSSSHTDT